MKFNFKPTLVGLLCAVLSIMVVTAHADVIEDILSRGELRVAVQTQGPPVSFVDKHGNRTGFAVEVARMMAEDMGVKLVLLDFDWKGLIPAVTSGKADLVAADMTPKPQRALVLSFTEPYMYTEVVLFAKKSKGFTTWQDACVKGNSIAVVQGSSSVDILKKKCPDSDIKEFSGGVAAIAQAVLADRADAGINGLASARGQTESFPEFEILEGSLKRGPLSFATRPDETHLVAFMDNYFRFIEADGRLEEQVEYWMRSTEWKKDH